MPSTLAKIKSMLDNCIGKNLTVTSHIGRKKVVKRKGILSETFPSIFVVELDHDESAVERVSYSYTDILTKNILVEFEGQEAGLLGGTIANEELVENAEDF
ncbi:Veg family protein [Ligilactobacillus cholophilus]|uniref:Veg family protein n=1 Tax=Ligilactobacillus cholophilus TaxID=3050131 RepID=UPI0025B02673|nr:Veg family protein [Ligilactobacillus cholophilus]